MTLHQLGWSDDFARLFEPYAVEGCSAARVSVVHRGLYIVLCENSETEAELSGRFLHRVLRPEDLPVTGDWVVIRPRGRLIDAVLPRRIEGVVAKQKTGPYIPGLRSRTWLEIRALQSGDFVVGGYTIGGARRKGEPFSQLLLGGYADGRFEFVGAVSGGLRDAEAKELIAHMEPLLLDRSPFFDTPAIPRLIYWTRPEIVCHVRFSEWTREGQLRFPIFSALRPDLDPRDCLVD